MYTVHKLHTLGTGVLPCYTFDCCSARGRYMFYECMHEWNLSTSRQSMYQHLRW